MDDKPWNDDKRISELHGHLDGREDAELPVDLLDARSDETPLYTLILHDARKDFGLTLAEYAVIDTIGVLSNKRRYPWCIKSKEAIADDLEVSRSTVFRAIAKGLEQSLLEKGPRQGNLRTTQLWIDTVTLSRRRLKKSSSSK